MKEGGHSYNGAYTGAHLNRVAFPLGGIGAGMICLEGAGAVSHVSVRNRPDVYHEPLMFGALHVKGAQPVVRVMEGPVPEWKIFGPAGSGNGLRDKTYGFPHFASARFEARFPFGTVTLHDPRVPLQAKITGWSPFSPGKADDSSLPMAALEYRFDNASERAVECVFSFHARNFMAVPGTPGERVGAVRGGFVLEQDGTDNRPWDRGAFCAAVDDPEARVNCAWFRGGWFDSLTLVWKSVAEGSVCEAGPLSGDDPSSGGSIYVPFRLPPGGAKTITVRLSWYVPASDLRVGAQPGETAPSPADGTDAARRETHTPWYATRFGGIGAVNDFWQSEFARLRSDARTFADCFFDTTLPAEVVEAVAANLSILKSPTLLRQGDGRLWCWEGCCDAAGCCFGSCTHVWNYAQALAHLFPELERGLRQTEFGENQDEQGHQAFRAFLPIRANRHDGVAASDGQLGGIMKVYRDWRIAGDTAWLRNLWPRVRRSLDYCIAAWDPDRRGVLFEPHHNTYDIEFWGPDGMCASFYLGALQAAVRMGRALDDDVAEYEDLLARGIRFMQSELFNGEYFQQNIQWQGLRAGDPAGPQEDVHRRYSPEAVRLLQREGPKYQYGTGCLADGVLGAWIAAVCGIEAFLDEAALASHLRAVHRYNLRVDLSEHANPQRPSFAMGHDGGLLLCTWPRGGAPTLPFPYSNEVWTGIEYAVASHLMMLGFVEPGLDIVRLARARYDGRVRNPFNEYECGHWYGRALSCYALLQGLTGARYDAVDRTLYAAPRLRGDLRAFVCTATGYGTLCVRDGTVSLEVRKGRIDVDRTVFRPFGG